jgi:hypothetical protein
MIRCETDIAVRIRSFEDTRFNGQGPRPMLADGNDPDSAFLRRVGALSLLMAQHSEIIS